MPCVVGNWPSERLKAGSHDPIFGSDFFSVIVSAYGNVDSRQEHALDHLSQLKLMLSRVSNLETRKKQETSAW